MYSGLTSYPNLHFQRPRGYFQKNLVGMCDPLPKPFTLFLRFPYPINNQTKTSIPYYRYGHCGRHSCLKNSSWRAFVYGLIDNEQRLASSKETYPIQDLTSKPYLFKAKMLKSIPKRLKIHSLTLRTHPYGPYKGEIPGLQSVLPGRALGSVWLQSQMIWLASFTNSTPLSSPVDP